MSNPTISTNEIYFNDDTSVVLTTKLNQQSTQINNLVENKAAVGHTHPEYEYAVQSKTKSLSLTLSNGTFSIEDVDDRYLENGKYVMSIKYTNGNNLVDQSLYMFKYSSASRLCSTFNLVKCNNSTDTLLATQVNGVVTFTAQYNGTGATSCTITFI